MRKFINISIIALFVVAMFLSCTSSEKEKNGMPTGTETTATYEYIKKISMVQPQKAMHLLEIAEKKHTMSNIDVNMLRSIVYNNSTQEYSKAVQCAEKALADPHIDSYPQKKEKLLYLLSSLYYECGEYSKCLDTADKGIVIASKQNNRHLIALFLMTIAQCHSEVGNTGHAINAYNRCLHILHDGEKTEKNWNIWNDIVMAYAMKVNLLVDLGEYQAAIGIRDDYEKALREMKKYPADVDGGNDIADASFFSLYSVAYEKIGRHKEGRDMFDKLTQTRTSTTTQGASHVVPYLLLTGNYDEALKRTLEEENAFVKSGRDTVNFYFSHMLLMNKARAQQATANYKGAISTAMRAYTLADSLGRRMKAQNATWISEKLGKKIMSLYIDKKEHELEINKWIIICLTLAVISCISLIVRIRYDNKIIRKKNAAATRLVDELTEYKEKLFMVIERKGGTPPLDNAQDLDENPRDRAVFGKIEKIIFNNKMFLQPKLTRQQVADRAGISLGRFNTLFARYSTMSFVNYINNLRIEYAAKLLKEKNNYSIEAIAHECGLPVRQTFYRLFTKRYGITPAEYRNSIEYDKATD